MTSSSTNVILDSVDALAACISDGAKLALFKDCGVPMALGRALVRRGARNLHLVTVPTGGMLPDLLIGAGCVSTVETAGVTLGEFGLAPRFVDAVKRGAVTIRDATCPAIYAGLQAAEKGIPFMPLRGLIGSDVLASRDDFKVIDNPFGDDDPIVCLPAIRPDCAIFHAPMADCAGNVYIARQAEMKILAHAARETFVTVERVVDFNLLEDATLAPATLNGFYVNGIAVAPQGAAPLNLPGHYDYDTTALRAYAEAAATTDGFAAWLADNVLVRAGAAA
ncbi:MAG: CoA-transferase [Gammaproteobacteria bacterium]